VFSPVFQVPRTFLSGVFFTSDSFPIQSLPGLQVPSLFLLSFPFTGHSPRPPFRTCIWRSSPFPAVFTVLTLSVRFSFHNCPRRLSRLTSSGFHPGSLSRSFRRSRNIFYDAIFLGVEGTPPSPAQTPFASSRESLC